MDSVEGERTFWECRDCRSWKAQKDRERKQRTRDKIAEIRNAWGELMAVAVPEYIVAELQLIPQWRRLGRLMAPQGSDTKPTK